MTTTPEQENCSHHWVIDTPRGPISTGHCKICELTREFMNSIGEANWDKSPQSQSKTETPSPSANIETTVKEDAIENNEEEEKEN